VLRPMLLDTDVRIADACREWRTARLSWQRTPRAESPTYNCTSSAGIVLFLFPTRIALLYLCTGLGLVGFQPVNGLPNVWRMVMTGDVSHITNSHIDSLLDDMVECSRGL
jgi:hypothetical protein